MQRRELLRVFRERLAESMTRGGLTQSALARRVGIDRSTLAQFLAESNKRLPRADTLSALAAGQEVSVDWLQPERILGTDSTLKSRRSDHLSPFRDVIAIGIDHGIR